jgi:hypothetical protein
MDTNTPARREAQPTENLFGWQDWPPETSDQRYPGEPGWKGTDTSREAALAIASQAKTLRDSVLNVLMDIAPSALSADQVAIRLQRSPLSIRPRISELRRLGLVERTEQRVTNESGMTACLWRAA